MISKENLVDIFKSVKPMDIYKIDTGEKIGVFKININSKGKISTSIIPVKTRIELRREMFAFYLFLRKSNFKRKNIKRTMIQVFCITGGQFKIIEKHCEIGNTGLAWNLFKRSNGYGQ